MFRNEEIPMARPNILKSYKTNNFSSIFLHNAWKVIRKDQVTNKHARERLVQCRAPEINCLISCRLPHNWLAEIHELVTTRCFEMKDANMKSTLKESSFIEENSQ